ncbi:MAG: hypothetical protein ACRDNZ_07065, partial [Streptosporangiaceae bacterium]
MDVQFLGTGGPAGWPEPGCQCASCQRAAAVGGRRGGAVLVAGQLRIEPGQPPRPADSAPALGSLARGACRVEPLPGGWDITGPDDGRLLIAGGPGLVPLPPAGTRPFDLLLLDMLGSPAQLGALRAQGLAALGATAAIVWADHR